jgi:hypothetical protein
MAQFARAVTREAICSRRAESGISCAAVWASLDWLILIFRLSLIFTENRHPPRIKSGAGFFGIML